jgi:hypothetical protein
MAKRLASPKRARAKRGNVSPKRTTPPEWSPGKFAVWGRHWSDPGNASPTTLMLRHPNAPFTMVVNDLDDRTLQSVTRAYLQRAISLGIEPSRELPDRWLQALGLKRKSSQFASDFGWLPIQWPATSDDDDAIAFSSFRAERISPTGQSLADQIIILMASVPVQDRSFGTESGLRVVLHACKRQTKGPASEFDIRITGLSASLRSEHKAKDVVSKDLPRSKSRAFLYAPLEDSSRAPGPACLFPIDPASQGGIRDYRNRRPSRSEAALKPFCEPIPVNMQRQSKPSPEDPMQVGAARQFVRTDAAQPGSSKGAYLSAGSPAVHSNQFAAESATKNFGDFFDRLRAYGLGVDRYFRLAKLPLRVAYRSGVVPGPGKDGQVVNARVFPDNWPADIAGPKELGSRPGLTVHLALANLRHRGRQPWNGINRSPAEPIGIAADARWVWHEIGHVALMASIGELEFRFAHSAGDALAAIAMDPYSKLAADPVARGLTFPWVFVTRRHDRCVVHGWSWGGTIHRAAAMAPYVVPHPRKAYLSEQILSSSLFRLYRCLGGDTNKLASETVEHRQLASHYTLYLILRAMQIMGTTGIVVGDDPDDFVSALIDADVGTQAWEVTYPAAGGERFERVGGCAHKAIRWAFEAQGLYTPDSVITDGPGNPPPVDIFIADNRPLADVTPEATIDYGPGNYLPVSLEWDRHQKGSDPAPRWQAPPKAIDVRGNNIRVRVGNRGSQTAANVKVRVWYRAWPKDSDPPTWQAGAGWTQCDPAVSNSQSISAGEEKTFGPFEHNAPTRRYIILCQASCDDDRANIDPAARLPCSYIETSLRDVVASDNNLALRVLKQS